MEWDLARIAIRALRAGTDLNTSKSNYRFFIGNTEKGVKVQIGKTAQIEIPDKVLQSCFHSLSTPQGYNTSYFQRNFPILYRTDQ